MTRLPANRPVVSGRLTLLWLCLALACARPAHAAPAAPSPETAAAAAADPAASRASAVKGSPFKTQRASYKAKNHYIATWGIDMLKVSYTASGNLIRFSYRVSEPERAAALGDKLNTPYLFNPRTRAMLQVPVMDKVGMLRQAARPEAGREYWMVFSNKGNLVKPGDRVNVVIGSFHADGLMVE